VARLNAETVRILALPDHREKMKSQGVELGSSTPEAFAAFLRADIAKWTKEIRDLKITID
jgi:tripartite-type tricarboxylate transporter receptor subunit TctC